MSKQETEWIESSTERERENERKGGKVPEVIPLLVCGTTVVVLKIKPACMRNMKSVPHNDGRILVFWCILPWKCVNVR